MEMNELITEFHFEHRMGVVETLEEYLQMNRVELPEDSWDFVGQHLPDYYFRNDVTLCDILYRFVYDNAEDINEKDLQLIPKDMDEAKELLRKTETKLLQEAIFASIVKGKECPKCGGIICREKAEGVDYPYFCPSCDENFYEFETVCH